MGHTSLRHALAALAVVRALVLHAAALAVTLALHADVIAEKCAEYEVLLGSELMQRTGDYQAYRIETLAAAEIQVQHVVVDSLHYVVYAIALKTTQGEVGIPLVEVNSTMRRTPF